MRWVLIVLVALVLIGIWVAAFFVPDLRWFAEALTAAVVIPPVAIMLFLWLRARAKSAAEAPDAAKARGPRPEVAAVRGYLRRALAGLARARGSHGAAAKLPWYVALGPPGAGRSTLLERADFAHVTPQANRDQPEPAEPPFDLRCSAEAVVLDARGTIADPTQTDLWLAILAELRRARPGRTLEGVLVTIGIPELIASTSPQRRELAGRLRARLDEMMDRIAMVLPVYVVLTKADVLPGFTEFWSNDPKRDEATWGASFATDDDRATNQPAKAVMREFAVLGESLHARALDRLPAETDPARRVRFLRFPKEVRTLVNPVSEFVDALCQPGATLERFLLRGFYLTSSGSAASGALARTRIDSKGSFFVDFVRSVLLPDRNLATVAGGAARTRSKSELRVSLIALAVALAVLGPALASYVHNADLARNVQSAAAALTGPDSGRTPGTLGDPIEPALDTLVRIEGEATGFGIRGWFGPRAARELHDPLEDVYVDRIHRWMLQKLRPALDKQLDGITWGAPLTDAPSTPEEETPLLQAYGVVKLYATLVNPKGHAKNDWAADHLAAAWRQILPAEDAVDPTRLTEHARRYLAALERRPDLAWPPGAPLAGVRTRLTKLQVQEMPYRRLLLSAREQPPLRASSVFGATSLGFLESRGDVQIPGVYTASGWQKIHEALASTAPWPAAAVVERWVLDDAGIPADDAGLRAQARRRYFADYVERWMRFLGELKVKTPPDIATAKEELTAFKDADGFYRTLFAQFKQNVVRDEDPATLLTVPESILSRVPWLGKAELDAGTKPAAPSPVEKSFRPILAFAGELEGEKSASPAPLDKYIAILDKLKAALDEAPSPKQSVQELQGPFIEAKVGVGELLDSTSEPTRSALARLLMPPVMGTALAVRAEGASSLAADWKSDVWTVWDQKLSKHFPFHGAEAVNFSDFAAFFKPDGVLWGFVHAHLADAVEEKGDGRYVPKQGADPVTVEGLQCLTVAQEISDAFFQGQDMGLHLSVQADWTAPDVKDAKFWVAAKDTALPQGQWSALLSWFGEDVRVEWQESGRPTQEFGRHSFSLFDLFGHLGGLKPSPAGHSIYSVDCPPLSLKVRPDGRVDPFRSDFFTRLHCPEELQVAKP